MSVPLRPDHVVSRRQQFQRRVELVRERLQLRNRLRTRSPQIGESGDLVARAAPGHDALHGSSSVSLLPGVVAGAFVALLGLGALWGWQAWSGRVSEPIDDRLPMLVSTDSALDVPEQPPQADETNSDDASIGNSPNPLAAAEPAVESGVPQDRTNQIRTATVVVHVSGAVVQPGVVTLDSGARVIDALGAAGGAASSADLDRVNLAAVVMDGERIHVPAQGEDVLPVVIAPSRWASPDAGASESEAAVILDINAATAEDLESLPGVGPSIARAIVQTRLNRGPFLSVDELLDVPGIGESKLALIRPFVTVGL